MKFLKKFAGEIVRLVLFAAVLGAVGASGQVYKWSQTPGTNATAQLIDVAQVQGQVHAQSVHRVGELAERNPNETATIVRQWLTEPAA